MKFQELIKSSFTTLRMNGRRTFLTMIGIIIGISSVITIMSLGNGFSKEASQMLVQDEQGRPSITFYFQPNNPEAFDFDKADPFTGKELTMMANHPGVDEVKFKETTETPFGYQDVKAGKIINNVNVGYKEDFSLPLLEGRKLTDADSEGRKRYALSSDVQSEVLFGSSLGTVGRIVHIDGHAYTIVGIYQEGGAETVGEGLNLATYDPLALILPEGTYKTYHEKRSWTTDVNAYFKEDANLKTISQDIVSELNRSGNYKSQGVYQFFDTTEVLQQVSSTFNMITYFVAAVAAISLFIAGVGVMNMMYISVSERIQEIGIRRSMGATKKSIQNQFLLEGIAITSIGGVIGYFLGMGLAKAISLALPFNSSFDWKTAVVSVLISVIIGIVFSVFPARSAANKNVVDILR